MSSSTYTPSPNDIEIRKLDYTESKNLHEFDKSLGKENKGFYRVFVEREWEKTHGVVYHYIMQTDNKEYRLRYEKTFDGRLKFTGDAVEVELLSESYFD